MTHREDRVATGSNSQFRHCEPTGRANARPMTGSAKQSILSLRGPMDCFVAFAPRNDDGTHFRIPAARCARVMHAVPALTTEGAGNAGCALHPRSRAQKGSGVHARAYRLSGGIRHSPRNGFTAYFVLSPVIGRFCHRHLANTFARLERQRRGVRTTRLRRPLLRHSSKAHPRPSHPIPRP
jgi:hypothetical protein